MNIKKIILILILPLTVYANLSFSGSYCIQNTNQGSSSSASLDGYSNVLNEELIINEYMFRIEYNMGKKNDFALMDIHKPVYFLRGAYGQSNYHYSHFIEGYDEDTSIIRQYGFDYKRIGGGFSIYEYFYATVDYYSIHPIDTFMKMDFLNYSVSGLLPLYPFYMKLVYESDIYTNIEHYYEMNILYKYYPFNLSLRIGNAEKYSAAFSMFFINNSYGIELSYLNLHYRDKFRMMNTAQLSDYDQYALLIGNFFDSEHYGLKLMAGFNNRYRLILIPHFVLNMVNCNLDINATIASFAEDVDAEYASHSTYDNFINCSVQISYSF